MKGPLPGKRARQFVRLDGEVCEVINRLAEQEERTCPDCQSI